MAQNPLCYGIYGNGWKIANYLLENIILGQRKMWEYQTECWAFKKLSVTMVVFSSFKPRVILLMSPQTVCLNWCKVAKIAFPRFFSRLISNVYANALLETMLNQITPKRPQITPRSHQKFPKACIWVIFFAGAGPRQTIFLQTEGTPPYFKWLFGHWFSF